MGSRLPLNFTLLCVFSPLYYFTISLQTLILHYFSLPFYTHFLCNFLTWFNTLSPVKLFFPLQYLFYKVSATMCLKIFLMPETSNCLSVTARPSAGISGTWPSPLLGSMKAQGNSIVPSETSLSGNCGPNNEPDFKMWVYCGRIFFS